MANVVYFSHSYRAPDADANDYFARLLASEQLVPSLDPPSESVNSAKLERHLNHSDAMVAVLTDREGGVSPYILYEISLAVRARKPLVVFVEDSLPTGIVPIRLLQQRFSRRSFLRQVREHRQALRALRSYLGQEAPPRYQPSTAQRTCLVLSPSDPMLQNIGEYIPNLLGDQLRYRPLNPGIDGGLALDSQEWWELMSSVDVVLGIESARQDPSTAYAMGAIKGALRPLISLTTDSSYQYLADIPMEYQPRLLDPTDLVGLRETVLQEFALFEEDFLDLDDQTAVIRYAQQLVELDGHYEPGTRERVTEVVMGDKYVSGQGSQTGAMGPNAHVHDVTFSQAWGQLAPTIDVTQLAAELAQLRIAARREATTPEDDSTVAALGEAQLAAENGDGAGVMANLAKATRWALSVAEKIGVSVAAAAIKAAIGL